MINWEKNHVFFVVGGEMKASRQLLKQVFAAGAAAVALSAGAVGASVIDAPHNETNNIKCGQCHAYSLWWTYSPAASSANPPYNVIADAVCDTCHGPGKAQFNKVTHSSANMGGDHSVAGPWERKCVDCHNPHFQEQLSYLPGAPDYTAADLAQAGGVYLAQGTMSAITDNGDGTTTFAYADLLTDPAWADMSLWTEKSGNAGRGLLVALSYETAEKTYEIAAVDPVAMTITVQSGAEPIPAAYENAHFGVTYGQLVKAGIKVWDSLDPQTVTEKTVKFFDSKNNGFVDTDLSDDGGVATGVCQVCHYNTLHYNQNGQENVAGDPISHYVGYTCTDCHNTSLGFKPEYIDHNTFIFRTGAAGQPTCGNGAVGCHIPDDFPDVVSDIHKRACVKCHNGSPPVLYDTYDGDKIANGPNDPPNWPTANVSDPDITPNNGYCWDCHGSYFDFHQNKTDHSADSRTGLPQVVGRDNCTIACHFHDKKDVVTGVHDKAGAGGTASCEKCHDLAVGGQLRDASTVTLAQQITPGDCATCHTTIGSGVFNHPGAMDHSGQVVFEVPPNVSPCYGTNGCHSGDPAYGVHAANTCSTCHDSQGGLYGTAKFYTDGTVATCGTCHPTVTASDDHWIVNQAAPVVVMDDSSPAVYGLGYPPVVIDAAATVSDAEQNWSGGRLTVQITAGADAADSISIGTDSTLVLSGATVLVNGTAVATLDAPSETGGRPFVVRFNAAATDNDVTAVLNHITFATSGSTTGQRTVTFTATDGAGASGAATRSVDVVVVM